MPTVHLNEVDGAAVKAYVTSAGAGATAKINQATIVYNVPAPTTAAFSSRGPLNAGGGDLLKPDLMAPGQDILAAVAPPGNAGRSFNLYSGTSMSAPHVAGLAALLMHLKNDDGDDDHHRGDWDNDNDDDGWSPMMIKSALMTTATDVLDAGGNTSPAVIFSQGAGHVSPNDAARPGLVFDSDEDDWLAFMCGAAPAAVDPRVCRRLSRKGFSFDASDLNVASIAIGDLAGAQTVTRTVTNVGRSRATYTASVTGMAGIDVKVSPASFTVRPGREQDIHRHLHQADGADQHLHGWPAHAERRQPQRPPADGRSARRARRAGAGVQHRRTDQLQREVRVHGAILGDAARPRAGAHGERLRG